MRLSEPLLRFERLGQEALLKMEEVFGRDRGVFDSIVASNASYFERHVRNVRITIPENGMLIGDCPACGARVCENRAAFLGQTVATGFVGSLVSGRWVCLTCQTDGDSADIRRFPPVLSALEPGGRLLAMPWHFRGPKRASVEGADKGFNFAAFCAKLRAAAPDWDHTVDFEALPENVTDSILRNAGEVSGRDGMKVFLANLAQACRDAEKNGLIFSYSGALRFIACHVFDLDAGGTGFYVDA